MLLEVDLQYPQEMHNITAEYPLAPERFTVTEEMLSPTQKFMRRTIKEITGHLPTFTPKLIPNLYDKHNYIVHSSTLLVYLQLGLKLVRIHRALKFRQVAWLKEYIEFNTEQRKLARSEFEKKLYKLLNNSVYGKLMEDVRKRRLFDLVHCDEPRLLNLVSKPTFTSIILLRQDLAMIERKKPILKLDKPIYCGQAVLDFSKTLMYIFHYFYMKPKFPNSKLLFTDTDSFLYSIPIGKQKYLEKIWEDRSRWFDLSNQPKPFKDCENKSVIGKMKDETPGKDILEFVGLRPKCYSFRLSDDEETKKAKGVNKSAINKQLAFVNYKITLFGRKFQNVNVARIGSKDHRVYTFCQTKKALCFFDDKRYLLDDVHTLPFGHYSIVRNKTR